ncbi:hypothetical protein EXIGLDRAFT_779748 [Exidia glandulosa HHB12029]|uniref:Uncharacterized protein n=1 Tax=Exidia glandulosa HHB12029 TaxID=1314781 RepID=A0A165BWZ3_EXIGL|nr:hypothetical protein EXIGLDRAFT_779748 [Exidia glandulosa HHB12029]
MFRETSGAGEPSRGAPVLALSFTAHRTGTQSPPLLSLTMHDRLSRRPVYATTTHGARTTLWRVVPASAGTLAPVAVIVWAAPSSGSGSGRAFPAVERNGTLKHVEEVLTTRVGTLFGRSPAKLFVAGPHALACRWKIHEFGLGQRRLSALTSTSTSTSSTTTPSDTVLAEFFPPNVGVLKPSLTLYSPPAAEAADDIVLTALLAAAGRDDWRSTQNQSPPIEEVRQSLSAGLGAGESFATLPPYTSTTDLPSY